MPNVVWRQWSDQYVSIILISVIVGSRFSPLKYFWQNWMSARSMASPRSSMKSCSCFFVSLPNPVRVSTIGGFG